MADYLQKKLDVVQRLSEVGIALSAERDSARLMELILRSAKELTNADGGTLYTCNENELVFEIMLTDSLGIYLGGASGSEVGLPNIPLYDAKGAPSEKTVAARAAVTGETVNIPDAYDATGYDFSGTRVFDKKTGYRSKSFLSVPMRSHDDEVIGVLQLINANNDSGEVVEFSIEHQEFVESLASQAAIAMTNKRLLDEQRKLFEAFIELIAGAIDDKSPYTGNHCRRVPELTLMLADAAAATTEGPLKDFSMSEEDRYELKIAGWLHDCGKVTTPEYVVDKSTKLETIFDRIKLVGTRFEVLKRDAKIRMLERILSEHGVDVSKETEASREYQSQARRLDEERDFLRHANIGAESMSEEDINRIRRIGGYRWRNENGEDAAFLTDDEVKNLTVRHGTLTSEERDIINDHIVATIKMLESLPYPNYLKRVPEFAGGHHERMDGKGYPRGLKREEMSVQARAMGIADVFEALTADDRPYKKAMRLSEALKILGGMKLKNHVDPDLFDVFVREKVYLDYARRFLEPEQIDEVNHDQIPGYGRPPEELAS
ncbi:MAG: GAF domain-containing protein [Gammaproteobacteria bacterium]|nr:GAF domain-containing protein [Gammaproteobacteria bacterium]